MITQILAAPHSWTGRTQGVSNSGQSQILETQTAPFPGARCRRVRTPRKPERTHTFLGDLVDRSAQPRVNTLRQVTKLGNGFPVHLWRRRRVRKSRSAP